MLVVFKCEQEAIKSRSFEVHKGILKRCFHSGRGYWLLY